MVLAILNGRNHANITLVYVNESVMAGGTVVILTRRAVIGMFVLRIAALFGPHGANVWVQPLLTHTGT